MFLLPSLTFALKKSLPDVDAFQTESFRGAAFQRKKESGREKSKIKGEIAS